MSDAAARPRPPLPFLIALGLLTALFIILGLIRSNRATLRGDEMLTVSWTREETGPAELFRNGAVHEFSPAPVFHAIEGILDRARARTNYLGLSYSGYYRLPSLLSAAAGGAAAALLLAFHLCRRPEPAATPWFLILCGVAVFWFHPKTFAFAGIARVYALWNSLWFVTLAWLLARPSSTVGLAVLLSLLASVATPACFQILSLAIAWGILRGRDHPSTGTLIREGAKKFAIPAAIAAYYALIPRHGDAEAELEDTPALLRFWLVTNLPAWLAAAAAGTIVFKWPSLRALRVPVLALSLLLLAIPVMFGLAHERGVPTPSRYYLWTTTGIPLAIFVVALAWPELKAWRPAPRIAVVLATGLVFGFASATFLRRSERNDSRILTCLEADSPLLRRLKTEVPEGLSMVLPMGWIEQANVKLLAEWIAVRYRALPRTGNPPVLILDVDGRLVAEEREIPPGTSVEAWTIPR